MSNTAMLTVLALALLMWELTEQQNGRLTAAALHFYFVLGLLLTF